MSAPGYVPDDEEEEPAPVEGPQLPDFIDRVNAEPLPPGASNGQMGDEQWPPAVPAEAPGMVPTAPPVVPPAVTGQPTPPPGPGAPLNIPAEQQKALGNAQTLEDQQVANERAQGDVRKNLAGIASNEAGENADNKAAYVDEQQQVMDEANKRTQQKWDALQAQSDRYANMEYHDYWADKSTANKVLAGLSILTGGMGRTSNKDNPGLEMVNQAIDRDWRMQTANMEKQSKVVAMARGNFEDARQLNADALANLKLKQAASADATAAKYVALRMKQGVPQEEAQTDANVIAIRNKGNQQRMAALKDLHAESIADAQLAIAKQKEADERLRAEAYAKKMGRAGAGGAANNAAEAKILDAIEKGAKGSDVRTLAAQLGVKPQRVDALENQGRAAAAAAAKTGIDPKLIVRLADGTEAGTASSARAVPQLQKDLRTLPRAIEQLKQLRDAHFVTPRSPLFHNAVLAVAATTSAGSTDANVAHEKGTLTNALGIPDNDAIDRKIAELENQLEAQKAQLTPLPDDYTPRRTAVAADASGAAPAPAAEPKQTPAAPATSKQARAKAIISDPSKRSLYSTQEWAKLVKASMGK